MDAKSAERIKGSSDNESQDSDGPRYLVAKRVVLVAGAAAVATNVWTGAPLLALVIGSKVQSGSGLSMTTVFAMIGVLAVLEFALGWALTWISTTYDRIAGRSVEAHRTSPWLRSLRGESEEHTRARYGVSAVERIVFLSVMAASLLFNVWYFFFAGSPLGS